jgi:cell division protein FtsZ
MIEFPRDQQNTIPTSSLKIIGLGGAGANMLDRIALDGIEGAELVAMNTDIRTLAGAVASEKITLGRNLTKGLGAGGDPELGHQAILEAESEIRATIKGRRIIFLCVGLGGGTGSGGAPIITRVAREEGAFVVVFATMPFVFEGKRRREQAETALNELAVLSNALVTFDNNRMGELVLAKQGIHEAFAAADHMISESIKAVIRLVVRPGLIHVGLDELMSALRTTRSRCLFGSGIASGKDRASRALRGALSSPLLDQGALLKDAQSVLVHLCGGEDLTLFEIELLMQGVMKFVPEKAHILFGAAVDPSMGANLSITLISALPEDCLASAPRQSLSRIATDAPALNPTIGFGRVETPPAPPQEAETPPSPPEPAPPQEAETPPSPPEPAPPQEAETPPSPPEPAPSLEAEISPAPSSPVPSREEDLSSSPFSLAPIQEAATPPPPSSPAPSQEEKIPSPPFSRAPSRKDAALPSPFLAAPPRKSAISPPPSSPVPRQDEEILPSPFSRAPETKAPDIKPLAEPAAKEIPARKPVRPPLFQTPFAEPEPIAEETEEPRETSVIPDFAEVLSSHEEEYAHIEEPGTADPLESDDFMDEPWPEPVYDVPSEPPVEEDRERTRFTAAEIPAPRGKPKVAPAQPELSLDGGPRGRFSGETPNFYEGEDLDIPPFMRKKKS